MRFLIRTEYPSSVDFSVVGIFCVHLVENGHWFISVHVVCLSVGALFGWSLSVTPSITINSKYIMAVTLSSTFI
jgi:hypothetical protein